jgi:hypothetical protein
MNVVILSSEKISEIKIRDRYNILKDEYCSACPGGVVFLAHQKNIYTQDMLKQILISKKKTKWSMWEFVKQPDEMNSSK